MPKIYSYFDQPPRNHLRITSVSMTEQSHARDCDINRLVSQYQRSGVLGDPSTYREMVYGNFSEIGSYHEQMQVMKDAKEKFDALPSNIRDAFGNDPGRLIDAVLDPSQKEKLQALGVFKAPAPAATPVNPDNVLPSAEVRQKAESTVAT